MKKRNSFLHKTLSFSVIYLLPFFLLANNILVSGVSLIGRNTTADYVQVKFNLTWNNSFRTSSGPANWDAAWVFVKYKIGANGVWKHATLSTSGGHNIPTGGTSTQPSDGKGIFIYQSTNNSGTFLLNNIELRWNYGTDGVPDESKIYVKVFAIEMVHVPQGNFQVGSGGQNTGEFRQANDVLTSGTATTFTITSATPTLQGNNASSSPTNISTRAGAGNDQLTGTTTVALNADFPTGYNAFYCMKYEISQGQYRDFLNTLTYDQQASRTANAPISSVGTGALTTSGSSRNGIEIRIQGTSTGNTLPAVYGCDLSGNDVWDDASDGEWIACNFLTWNDIAAYLDWAALRPMTELEYEKACRGNITPVANECAWGTSSFTAVTSLQNSNQTTETPTNSSANVAGFGNPVRVGMFANGSSSRISSGSSYYGIMDLSGNIWEQVISIANSHNRAFTGVVGNGTLASNGNADATNWPTNATLIGVRGGAFNGTSANLYVSDRSNITVGASSRNLNFGGRGVR
jgi:formylglycine-generating enzyme required for sulfatase activity